MTEQFKYVRDTYGVPAEIGRIVIVSGRAGIITEDRGHYIGVTFDDEKPGNVWSAHPTSEVEYLGMGTPRKLTRSQIRYRQYLEVADLYDGFGNWLKAQGSRRTQQEDISGVRT